MSPGKTLHNIQLDIITELCEESPLRFTELHPRDVPNNVFSYHLKKLLETGYIVNDKVAGGYEPTRKARKLLSYVDKTTRHTTAPKLITMLLVKDPTGKILLTRRKTQPFPNWFGLPSGMVHYGERIEDAARRELAEKTGLRTSRPIDFIGILDFQYHQLETKDIFVHANAYVYSHTLNKQPVLNIPTDSYSWSNLDGDHILPEVNAAKIMDASGLCGVTSISFIEPSTECRIT